MYRQELHEGCHMRSRNCLPFQSTWIHPGFQWDLYACCSIFIFLCSVLQIVVCHFVLLYLHIVLSVVFRFTVSGYPFGIFKLFLFHAFISQDSSRYCYPFDSLYRICLNCNGLITSQYVRTQNPTILFVSIILLTNVYPCAFQRLKSIQPDSSVQSVCQDLITGFQILTMSYICALKFLIHVITQMYFDFLNVDCPFFSTRHSASPVYDDLCILCRGGFKGGGARRVEKI